MLANRVLTNLDIAENLLLKYGVDDEKAVERVFHLWQNEERYGDPELAEKLYKLFKSIPMSLDYAV